MQLYFAISEEKIAQVLEVSSQFSSSQASLFHWRVAAFI